ncbi:MAG TPA: VOC family protein, partial [Acidobacteriota bacterium]|nr:VOC family protein [Acidobacteriota bacterium]
MERRHLACCSLTLAFVLGLLALFADAQPITSVDSIVITVSDADRAIDFYSNVLKFQKVSDIEVAGADYEHLQGVFGLRMRVIRMRLGSEFIELLDYLAPEGKPLPIDSRSNDLWFQHIAIIVSDMDRAYQWLRQNKVQHASSGPQLLPAWNKNAGGISAFYFKDPDGHALEILHFPPDKGDPKWHKSTDQLFLGIDNTAIAVSDTEASRKFYRDLLGFQVAGESENFGTEQEHLNNVFGARLRITSMKPPSGPSIEFLEYLAPRDGRPLSVDARPNDLLAWTTRLYTNDTDALARSLSDALLISPGVVKLDKVDLGFARGLLLRDPDGHIM